MPAVVRANRRTRLVPYHNALPPPPSSYRYSVRRFWSRAALCLLGLTGPLAAQSAAEKARPAAANESTEGDMIALSPFVVNASEDRGYQAQSTLSGSRMKSDLKDLASPVSAFTEQFLLDAAIVSTDELAGYMLSTEFDFGEESGGQNRLFSGNGKPLRMRGLAGGEVTTNFFKNGGNVDAFSTERIDQARGPNAILFGVGNPGGIINTSTKRAKLNGDSGTVASQVRSFAGTRLEGDYNQVVLPGVLAVRLSAVDMRRGSWRNHEFNDERRYFGTLKWRVTKTTELVAEAERGHLEKRANRTFTALDGYTVWAAAGHQLSAVANPAAGIERHSGVGTTWLVLNQGNDTLLDYSAATRTVARNQTGGDPVVTDFSVLPKETSILGDGMGQTDYYTRLGAFLTQSLGPQLNFELAAMRYDDDFLNVDAQNNLGRFLRFDPDPVTPLGTPNPNAGRAYLEADPQINPRKSRTDAVRLSGNYRLDLGFFGKHLLAGVHEYNYDQQNQANLREFVVSSNAPSTRLAAVANRLPENNNNRVWRRTYVDLAGPSPDIVLANWRLHSSNLLRDAVTGNTYETAFIPFGTGTVPYTATETRTTIGLLQSNFWRDRLRTTVGLSREARTTFSSTYTRLPPMPGFTQGQLSPLKTPATEASATSQAFSIVFNPIKALGFTYSEAHNLGLPRASGSVPSLDGTRPNQLPPRVEGNSRDLGLKLDLFERRLFLSAIYFETSSDNDFDFSPVTSQASIDNIWDALAANGVVDPLTNTAIVSPRDIVTGGTFSSKTQGYEVELTANPTPQWRLFLNYTCATTQRANVSPEMVAYIAQQRDYWTQGDRPRMYLNGRGVGLAPTARDDNTSIDTIQEQLDVIDQNLLNNVAFANGRRPLGQIPQRVNFRTTYDFDRGAWKGVSLGGGTRWFDRTIIGFIGATAASAPVITYGPEQIFFDLNVSYRRRLGFFHRKLNWSIQLNVNNALNNAAYVPIRLNNLNEVLNYRFNPPREFILMNRISF